MSLLESKSGLTMAILGCGNMGQAILTGLLSSPPKTTSELPSNTSNFPLRPISRFIACVKSPESIHRVQTIMQHFAKTNGSPCIEVWLEERNLEAVQSADIVLLSCQPSQVAGILTDPCIAGALSGKLLLSICLGISAPKIAFWIGLKSMVTPCTIVHAMPNTASTIQQSSTILCSYDSDPELSPAVSELVNYIFSSIGIFTTVPESLMPAASITAASTPAFFALALEGVIEGAVALGIPRKKATIMTAQAMKGAAEMALEGEDPKIIKEKIMTPNGCTEKGVRVLENGNVSGRFAEALIIATEKAIELGQ